MGLGDVVRREFEIEAGGHATSHLGPQVGVGNVLLLLLFKAGVGRDEIPPQVLLLPCRDREAAVGQEAGEGSGPSAFMVEHVTPWGIRAAKASAIFLLKARARMWPGGTPVSWTRRRTASSRVAVLEAPAQAWSM